MVLQGIATTFSQTSCPARPKNAIHFFATLSHLIACQTQACTAIGFFQMHSPNFFRLANFRFVCQIVWHKPERFLGQIGTPELAVHQWWKFLCQVVLIQASSWTNQASTYCALYGNFNGFSFSFYFFFSLPLHVAKAETARNEFGIKSAIVGFWSLNNRITLDVRSLRFV